MEGRFLNRAGRLKLLNSVLTAIPTYFLTVFEPKKIDGEEDGQDTEGFSLEGL